jgi:hypothetical protein
MAKGPELKMKIVSSQSIEAAPAIKIRAFRENNVFKDNILKRYSQSLKRFIKENPSLIST